MMKLIRGMEQFNAGGEWQGESDSLFSLSRESMAPNLEIQSFLSSEAKQMIQNTPNEERVASDGK